jgi:hypothetical protein
VEKDLKDAGNKLTELNSQLAAEQQAKEQHANLAEIAGPIIAKLGPDESAIGLEERIRDTLRDVEREFLECQR